MEAFRTVVEDLKLLADAALRADTSDLAGMTLDQALNGGPSGALRKQVAIADLRQAGAFFTGRRLADHLAGKLASVLVDARSILDPACGAGDLLLACARRLPVHPTLSATLQTWGQRLFGYDTSEEFIEATRIRLLLQAIELGVQVDEIRPLSELLPGIQVRDGLTVWGPLEPPVCVVLNPPYTTVQAPEGCGWGSGKVSQAAVFVEHSIRELPDGSTVAAILPDVLRSGSRYVKWRELINPQSDPVFLDLDDQFDAQTDIHVFTTMLRTVKSGKPANKTSTFTLREEAAVPCVGDDFDVNVGAVVPHRDPEEGVVYPYLHARSVPRWATHLKVLERRAFTGRVFRPPFVTVRRTSRPEDPFRAVGAVVVGSEPTAVENHLLVFSPRSKSLADCYRLLENLRSANTNGWLNERIRCRHLTVRALRRLPWWDS
jgi:hypothetical protein